MRDHSPTSFQKNWKFWATTGATANMKNTSEENYQLYNHSNKNLEFDNPVFVNKAIKDLIGI